MPKKTGLICLAPGFEEIETIIPTDYLRRAGMKITIASVGVNGKEVTGANGVTILADKRLQEVSDIIFDLILTPGGLPGATNLANDETLIKMIKKHHLENKCIASICASPGEVLAGACNILQGKKACGYPGCDSQILATGGVLVQDPVCVDGNIITARGPGLALKFSIKIIEYLFGKHKADTILEDTLANNA